MGSASIPLRIVVVDDHASVADSVAYALQSELNSYQLIAVSTLSGAEQKLIRLKPVAGIVDWQLSAVSGGATSGIDLIRRVSLRLPETRWILFTAFPRAYVLKEGIAAGVAGCVSKSAGYSELVDAIRSAIAGRQYFCEESQRALVGLAGQHVPINASETDILRLLARGHEPKEIADRLGLSVKSVHNYLSGLRHKTGVASMVALARYAERRGIAAPEG